MLQWEGFAEKECFMSIYSGLVSTHPRSHLSPPVDVVSLFEFPDDECNEQQREKTAVNQTDHTRTLNDGW